MQYILYSVKGGNLNCKAPKKRAEMYNFEFVQSDPEEEDLRRNRWGIGQEGTGKSRERGGRSGG